jgi:hypothetical protein
MKGLFIAGSRLGKHAKPHDGLTCIFPTFGWAEGVAQIFNLLYHGFSTRGGSGGQGHSAECNSAIQQNANLRYEPCGPSGHVRSVHSHNDWWKTCRLSQYWKCKLSQS